MKKIIFSGTSHTLGLGLEFELHPRYSDVEWLKENEEDLDRAEEQLQLLFNNVLESLSSFDVTKPSFAMIDLTPVIQGSI